MQFSGSRILIFAKAPEPGYVKTRLIPAIGTVAATALYQQLLSDTVAMACRSNLAPVECWCAPDIMHPFFRQLAKNHSIELFQQTGDDLGERMATAAERALKQADSVILIGTDCPLLGLEHLQQTFSWLSSSSNAVLGPAEDGGYVLLGLNQFAPELFQAIPWGGSRVLSLTRERLRGLGWQWMEHTPLWDLDRPEDLARYRQPIGRMPC